MLLTIKYQYKAKYKYFEEQRFLVQKKLQSSVLVALSFSGEH